MSFQFKPDVEIREFKGDDFVGKVVSLSLGRLQNDKQMVSIKSGMPEYLYSPFAWVKPLGEEGQTIRRKIQNVFVMEAMNGGRSDTRKYDSYWDYFNPEKKKEIQQYWHTDLMVRIFVRHGGDPDRADIVFDFGDFEISDHCWDMVAPEEWYSEQFAKDPRFRFERGFYESAEETMTFFRDKPHNDIFGERYFPVIVFPRTTRQEKVFKDKKDDIDFRGIAMIGKAWSKPIMTERYVVFGVRCKPYQLPEVVEETYKVGGFVARAQEWNWD